MSSTRSRRPDLVAGKRVRAPTQRDAERTQAELLAAATEEFARVGYYGARVDVIAAKTATTKRMIYYYFRDKDGLFTAVLDRAYADIRAAELDLDLEGMSAVEALTVLIRHTFEYHDAHPQLARLVTAENSLEGRHLPAPAGEAGLPPPVVTKIDALLQRGRAEGELYRDVDAVELHLMMSALALFRITTAPTTEATVGVRMETEEHKARQIELLTSMVTTWLSTPEGSAQHLPG